VPLPLLFLRCLEQLVLVLLSLAAALLRLLLLLLLGHWGPLPWLA